MVTVSANSPRVEKKFPCTHPRCFIAVVSAPQHFLGIEIGGTKLQVVAGDASATVLERRRYAVDRSLGRAGILDQLSAGLSELVARWKPVSVGAGFGGPIDWRTGRIARSHHVEGWSGFGLSEWLGTVTGVPARADNDANVAALGEARRGAGEGLDPVFYVTLGSGVGGGLVVNGAIYHGAAPGESEIGHVWLDRSGTIVEGRCSGWALDAKIRKQAESGEPSVMTEWLGSDRGGEAKWLLPALEKGDGLARRILNEFAEDLALGLSHVAHLFHPGVIVIGGGLSLVGEPLRAEVAGALPKYLMGAFQPGPAVRLAGLGEDAVPVGALLMAVNSRISGPCARKGP